MPFWKQSEDPWDRKPEKRRPPPKEPRENPLDSLKTWNEERKAKAKEKEAAKWLPPEKCPWCQNEMEQGFFTGGRDGVHWYPGIYKAAPFRGLDSTGRIDVLDEGSIWSGCYKTVWLCRECKRAVFNMPDPPAYDPFSPLSEDEGEDLTGEEEDPEDREGDQE